MEESVVQIDTNDYDSANPGSFTRGWDVEDIEDEIPGEDSRTNVR